MNIYHKLIMRKPLWAPEDEGAGGAGAAGDVADVTEKEVSSKPLSIRDSITAAVKTVKEAAEDTPEDKNTPKDNEDEREEKPARKVTADNKADKKLKKILPTNWRIKTSISR